MTTTTYSDFDQKTEGLEVAEKFAGEIQGKTILVTGVNKGGIGFSTAEAFVSDRDALNARTYQDIRLLNLLPSSS